MGIDHHASNASRQRRGYARDSEKRFGSFMSVFVRFGNELYFYFHPPRSCLIVLGSPSQEDEIRRILSAVYKKLVLTGTERLMSAIDIADIIKSRIDAMSIAEMEKMVLQVMKKELTTIVNLGALIGFLIGLLNNLL